jgi:nicotinamidase-related amidase
MSEPMPEPTTFRRLAGLPTRPAPLAESALVLIDCQREYVDGAVPVPGMAAAVERARRLLVRARELALPIFHIAHRGAPGSRVFDPEGPYCEIVPEVAPLAGEAVVHKATPNAFAGTDLGDRLAATARRQAVFAGFMTHNCVSASVRGAFDLGYLCAVAADAVATRDLPDGRGGVIAADLLHRAELAGLADRVATVVENVDEFT